MMGRIAVVLFSPLLLCGCALLTTERTTITVRPPVYSADEIDAINAQNQCKQTARNQLEIARCIVRQ